MIKIADYYNSSIGVFQGGGVKAIAYIGAYKAAYNAGIMFSDLAGTSAGSIIAALIAVGATPEDIERLISCEKIKDIPRFPINEKKWYSKIPVHILAIIAFVLLLDIFIIVGALIGLCYIFIGLYKLIGSICQLIINIIKQIGYGIGRVYTLCCICSFINGHPKFIKRLRTEKAPNPKAPQEKDSKPKKKLGIKLVLNKIKGSTESFFDTERMIYGSILMFISNQFGVFSSKEIERIVGNWFEKLGKDRNVCFNDLDVSLSIVSTDINLKGAHVWNKKNTGNERIAKAVAASCAIPIYFTPVEMHHVDGGVISNRPDYVFSDAKHLFPSILSFELTSEEKKPRSFKSFISRIVSTVIDGSDELQHNLLPMVQEIKIDVKDVSATDFKKIDKKLIEDLISYGESAMNEFLDQPVTQEIVDKITKPQGLFETRERLYSEIAKWSYEKYDSIVIYERNLDWVWSLFPSLLSWVNNGTKILVFSEDNKDDYYSNLRNWLTGYKKKPQAEAKDKTASLKSRAEARRRLLENLGCKIDDFKRNKTKGFFFLKENNCQGLAIQYISDERNWDAKIKSKVYSDAVDSHLLKIQFEAAKVAETLRKMDMPGKIKIEEDTNKEIITLLKGVEAYKDLNIYTKEVELSELNFLNPWLRAFEYNQTKHIYNLYKDNGIQLYSPSKLILPSGRKSLMAPIVLERHEGKLYVIKGNTRCLYAYKHGDLKVQAVIVDDVTMPMPVKDKTMSYKIEELFVQELDQSGKTRYDGFDIKYFRPIEEVIRPNETYLKDGDN